MSGIEIAIPLLQMEFDFHGGRSPSYLAAPSTPKRFGEYEFLSAPASPSKLSESHGYPNEEQEDDERVAYSIRVPFEWEEKPGVPKAVTTRDDDFAFAFGSEQEKASVSTADELFDGGKIKTLKGPPGLKIDVDKNPWGRSVPSLSPLSKGKKMIKDVLSPRKKTDSNSEERGRERGSGERRSSRRRESRSLSPLRVTGYQWQETEQEDSGKPKHATIVDSMAIVSASCTPSYSKSSTKKWSLKDLLLFRSASEGRSSERDPLRKYSAASVMRSKGSSFRCADGSVSSRRRAPVSPHELHYTINRAVAEDLRKKTFLPYRQGLLGGLAYNPAVQALSNRFTS